MPHVGLATWEPVLGITVLAQGVDEDKVTPGLLGFVVVALLGLATYLLIRSMNRAMRRIEVPRDDEVTPAADNGVVPPGPAPDDDRDAGR